MPQELSEQKVPVEQQEQFPIENRENLKLGFKHSDTAHWSMRNDDKRILLYELMHEGAVINQTGMLTPTEAVLMSLFDGKRTVKDVTDVSADLFSVSAEEARQNVDKLLSRWGVALEEKKNGQYSPQFDPKDFVIPAWKVDVFSKRFYRPMTLVLRPTDDCMRDCVYCNVEKRKQDKLKLLSLERWGELAEEIKSIGVVSLTMTGGDPFFRKDFLSILEHFTSRGMYPFVATKSHVSKATARKLADLGINDVQISIDAPNAETTDFLTNSKGFFNQAVDSIKNLLDADIPVSTNAVITGYNVLQAPALVTFLRDLGVKSIKLSQFSRPYHKECEDTLFINEAAGLWLEDRTREISEADDSDFQVGFGYLKDFYSLTLEERREAFKDRSLCTGSRWGFTILSDGKVIPCDELPAEEEYILGDVTHQSIMEVWRSEQNKKYLAPEREYFKGTECFDCAEFEECHNDRGRCYRDSLKALNKLFAPPPMCPRSPDGIRLC